MKQKGPQWIGPDGAPTAYKYVPQYERQAENIGQKLAALAVRTENQVKLMREEFATLCEEMLTRYKANNKGSEDQKSFSFTTFDKEFRIEVSMPNGKPYYRVYQATKQNPKFNEYRLINMDFSRNMQEAGKEMVVIAKEPETPSFNEESAPLFSEEEKEILR